MALIKVREVLANAGIDVPEGEGIYSCEAAREQIERWAADSAVPSCCDECGEVEPDGHCEHGYPSVLLALGLL